MAKNAVLQVELEPELRDALLAEAQASERPVSDVFDEMVRDFLGRQEERRAYHEFLRRKVERARQSVSEGRVTPHEEVRWRFDELCASMAGRKPDH